MTEFVGVHGAGFASVERGDLRHIFLAEPEVEDVDVFADPRRVAGLWDGDEGELDVPSTPGGSAEVCEAWTYDLAETTSGRVRCARSRCTLLASKYGLTFNLHPRAT